MKRNVPLLITSGIILILFVLAQFRFIVREGESVVLTSLGKPKKAFAEPGWYGRLPWPIHKKHPIDARLRVLETPFEENLTADGKNVLTGMFVSWRVEDPILFLQRVGTVDGAEDGLLDLLRAAKSAEVGRHDFSHFVNTNERELQLDSMEDALLLAVAADAKSRYGIDVAHLGLNRIGLPQAITESVFERMRSERRELAQTYRSQGEAEARRIRAEADAQRTRLLAEADAEAKRLHGEADAAAAASYQALASDPELAVFLRKLDSVEKLLKEDATVILSTDSEPFGVMRSDVAPKTEKSTP